MRFRDLGRPVRCNRRMEDQRDRWPLPMNEYLGNRFFTLSKKGKGLRISTFGNPPAYDALVNWDFKHTDQSAVILGHGSRERLSGARVTSLMWRIS